MFVGRYCVQALVRIWKSEDSLQTIILHCYHLSSKDEVQVTRLGGGHLHWLSHLHSPEPSRMGIKLGYDEAPEVFADMLGRRRVFVFRLVSSSL